MKCLVVTPEKTVLDVEAKFVALPLYDGEYGVMANHTPMVGRLGTGELRIETENGQLDYYIDGGFVEIIDNTVCFLTQKAIPVADIDLEAAKKGLEEALKRPMKTAEELEIRNRIVNARRVQVHLASKRK